MSQKTLAKVVEFVITMEEELLVRQKNITIYCQANSDIEQSDDLDEEDHSKTKRKDTKVQFDTITRGVYCQNYYNEGHFTKECKILNKFFQICKSKEHNTYHYLSKTISERCPSKEIVLIHIVQVEVPIIQEQQQQSYEAPP